MNINFGLFPPIAAPSGPRGKGPRAGKNFERKRALTARALADLDGWLAGPLSIAAE
jgi:methylenetetrahydrofolate--tRNA-(uracil-5-)-methyltransferase